MHLHDITLHKFSIVLYSIRTKTFGIRIFGFGSQGYGVCCKSSPTQKLTRKNLPSEKIYDENQSTQSPQP